MQLPEYLQKLRSLGVKEAILTAEQYEKLVPANKNDLLGPQKHFTYFFDAKNSITIKKG